MPQDPKPADPKPAATPAPPRSAAPGDPVALKRYRRKRRIWLAVKILAVLLVLFLGALIYAQSGHAIRHIYLPIASKSLGTQITASGGDVHLNGTVDLNDFLIMGSDGKPAFTAQKIHISVVPTSLTGGGIPAVRDVLLDQPHMAYRIDAAGKNNWSFLPKSEAPAQKKDPQPFPSIRLQKLEIAGLQAEYQDATGMDAKIEDMNLTVNGFNPGSAGTFDLAIQTRLDRPAENIHQQSKITGKGSLTQSNTGDKIDYDANIDAALNGLASAASPVDTLDALLAVKGTLQATGSIQQTLDLSAKTPQGPVGQMQTAVNWDPESPSQTATVKISGVNRDFLNPILAAVAPVQLVNAAINADFDVTGSKSSIDVKSTFAADKLSFLVAGRPDPSPPVSIKFNQEGSYQLADSVATLKTMAMNVVREGSPLLDVTLDQPVALNLAAKGGASEALAQANAKLHVVLHDLTVDTLRPWMTIAGVQNAGSLSSGTFNSDLAIQVAGNGGKGSVDVKSSFTADKLSVLVPGKTDTTPPLSIKFNQEASYQLADSLATLKAMTLNVVREGSPLLDVTLDQPIELNLAAKGGANAAMGATAPKVHVALHDLTVEAMRPWMAMAGVPDAGGLTAGTVKSDMTIQVADQGGHIDLSGTSSLTGMKLANIAGTPVNVNKTFALTIDKLNDLKIQKGDVQVTSDGRPVMTMTTEGSADIKAMAGDMKITASLPGVLGSLRQLGLLTGPPPQGVGDGSFSFTQEVKLAGLSSPASATGEARLEGATLAMRGSAPAQLGMHLVDDLQFDPKAKRLKISQLKIDLNQPAPAKPGSVEVKGEWPVAAGPGNLACTVRSLDLSPWLQMTRAMAAEQLPPIPFEADETIERLADGKLNLKGETRVGLTAPGAAGMPAEALPVKIQSELAIAGQKIEKMLVDFNGKAGTQPGDHIHLEGTGLLGAITAVDVDLNVERFNADPYLAAVQMLSGKPAPDAAGSAAPAAPKPVETPPPGAVPAAPPVKVAAKWTVGDAAYQAVHLTEASGTGALDNGVATFKMDKGKFAEGAMTADASYDMARIDPRYSWKAGLTDASLSKLAALSSPEMAAKATGTATFSSHGSGEGLGDAMKRHLDGRADFSLKNGELHALPILDKISEATANDTFKNLKFFEIAGGADLAKGQGKLDNVHMTGPENKITVDGTFDADGAYNLQVNPSLSNKIIANTKYAQYAAIATDSEGYVRLPLSLAVAGKGAQYSMRPAAALPFAGANGQPPDLSQTMRGVLQGVAAQQAAKDAKKNGAQDQKTSATATPAAPASLIPGLPGIAIPGLSQPQPPQPATQAAPSSSTAAQQPAPTPKPEKTPKPNRTDAVINALGGILQQQGK